MDTNAESLDRETHRRLGVDLFNKTWTLMDKESRTPGEDDEMIHCAHASAYHWMQVGTAANRARSEWQCSRMYTVLGRADPALAHAQRCLEICESEPGALEDWDLPFAYEALARAYAVAGDAGETSRCLDEARSLAAAIADDDDRALIEADLATIRADHKNKGRTVPSAKIGRRTAERTDRPG